MRIMVNGQQAFGKAVLEALLDRGEDVVAVYGPETPAGRRPDPIVEAAHERDLPVYQPESFKGEAVADELRALAPDLGVMAFVTKLVPSAFLDVPKLGTIQYHPSLLPRHRGPSSINWPIIQGETETGLTVFWPDDGLDEGPILLQKTVVIEPDDTLGSVYFQKLFPLGVEAMLEAVDLVREGKAPRIEQDHSKKTYESWCTADDAEIDWARPVAELYNLIRGTNPAPGAWTKHEGRMLQIFDSRKSEALSGPPGEVVAIDDSGIAVAAQGGAILVQRVRPEGGDKMPAADFVAQSGLTVGTKFGA